MVALIMGIASIALTVVSFFGVPVVGWVATVLGILAWIFGAKAVKADPTDGKSKTGKIIGMVATIIPKKCISRS